ncbi:MAG: hypothetical protein ACP5EN_13150 [Rhodovulum sp.]
MPQTGTKYRPCRLSPAEQLPLRETSAAEPARLTDTYSRAAKTRHGTAWLTDRGVTLRPAGLSPEPAALVTAAGPACATC